MITRFDLSYAEELGPFTIQADVQRFCQDIAAMRNAADVTPVIEF